MVYDLNLLTSPRKTYLHHQYKSVHQQPDSSTINQTDYWENVMVFIEVASTVHLKREQEAPDSKNALPVLLNQSAQPR